MKALARSRHGRFFLRKAIPVDQVMAEERAAAFAKRSIKAAKLEGLKLAVSMVDLTTLEVRHAGQSGVPLPESRATVAQSRGCSQLRRRLRLPDDGARGEKISGGLLSSGRLSRDGFPQAASCRLV